MTATLSATARITSSSWVISTMVTPISRLTRPSRASTSAVVLGSSALVASSASSSEGSVASARAMPTRCFCPPDSCSGWSCARSRSPTKSSSRATRRSRSRAVDAGHLERVGDVASHRTGPEQVELLEDHADVPADSAPVPLGQGGDLLFADVHLSARRRFQPVDQPDQGALARAGVADDAEHLTLGDLEADIVQGHHPGAVAAPGERLGDIGQAYVRRGGRHDPPRVLGISRHEEPATHLPAATAWSCTVLSSACRSAAGTVRRTATPPLDSCNPFSTAGSWYSSASFR